jgi:hypothetical protein
MATSFSVTVDNGAPPAIAPTITVTVDAAAYGAGAANVMCVDDSNARQVAVNPPPPGGAQPPWTFTVAHGGQYTVVVNCGTQANVTVVNIP